MAKQPTKKKKPHPRWTDIRPAIIRDEYGNITHPTDPMEKAWVMLREVCMYYERKTGDNRPLELATTIRADIPKLQEKKKTS